jgi:hypothetical protein
VYKQAEQCTVRVSDMHPGTHASMTCHVNTEDQLVCMAGSSCVHARACNRNAKGHRRQQPSTADDLENKNVRRASNQKGCSTGFSSSCRPQFKLQALKTRVLT